jgi:nucleotide-binding universal stress UspA family protein
MTIKTILAAASGGSASTGVFELSAHLAHRFGAALEGFHVKIDARELAMAAGGNTGMMALPGWIDQITAEADVSAAKVKAAFEATTARHQLPGLSVVWREEVGYAPTLVPQRGRFFDLVVLGRSERVVDQPSSLAIEQALLYAGRPVLLAPAEMPSSVGASIAIAWDGSPAAVRAMTAALPFLTHARTVAIVTIGPDFAEEGPSVVAYLARHGVTPAHRQAANTKIGIGVQLLDEAKAIGADLLVMGGYGHAPWRESLFGGATRDVVTGGLLPILLSH